MFSAAPRKRLKTRSDPIGRQFAHADYILVFGSLDLIQRTVGL